MSCYRVLCMISKKPFLVSSLLGLPVVDTYNKPVGKVSDVILGDKNFNFVALMTSQQQVIVAQLIKDVNQSNESKSNQRKKITLNIADYRLEKEQSADLSHTILFSEIKNKPAYATGEFIGRLFDIIPSPDGQYLFIFKHSLLKNLIGRLKDRIDLRYIVAKSSIQEIGDKKIFLPIPSSELHIYSSSELEEEINNYFMKQKILTEFGDFKKRYLVLEAPIETAAYHLNKKKESHQGQTQNLFIKALDSNNKEEVDSFVTLFNLVLMTSPDTYVPITGEQAKKHFSQGTFLGYKAKKIAAYVCTLLEDSVGVIAGIGIHPNQRGKKISFPMLSQAIEWLLTQKEVETIQCDVFENNLVSKSLFESLGFKQIDDVYLD